MLLNNISYLHVRIRKLCDQLEFLSGLKMITNLDEEFVEIRLMSRHSYIIINWRKNTVFTLCHKLTEVELAICNELMINCNWLETGENIKYMKGGKNNGVCTK